MDLYALDFDGVLCDSCNEASVAALEAARRLWPQIFEQVDSESEKWLLEHLRNVRPVVERGDDFLLLVRLMLETRKPEAQKSPVVRGLTEESIVQRWETLKPALLEEWDMDSKPVELEQQLGAARDSWIARDSRDWLQANRLYPGIAQALKCTPFKIFVVTTKETRFVRMSFKELAGIDLPEDHIYGSGSGPKVEVLEQLQTRADHQGMTLHFVEDRLATLLNVIKKPELEKWNLYLASWGYNTANERETAASVPRVRVLELQEFCSKLEGTAT